MPNLVFYVPTINEIAAFKQTEIAKMTRFTRCKHFFAQCTTCSFASIKLAPYLRQPFVHLIGMPAFLVKYTKDPVAATSLRQVCVCVGEMKWANKCRMKSRRGDRESARWERMNRCSDTWQRNCCLDSSYTHIRTTDSCQVRNSWGESRAGQGGCCG